MRRRTVQTPIGPITVTEQDGAVAGIDWGGAHSDQSATLDKAAAQIEAYFDGSLTAFDLPLAPPASESHRLWRTACTAIRFGETLTYGDVAAQIGWSPQAVGQACGANPIPLVVPCHRILGTANLGGYSGVGGVETKVILLRHEGAGSVLI